MRRSRHALVGVVVVLGMTAPVPSVRAATECKADVRARLTREEVRDSIAEKTFAVEIDTKETCATVYVDFTATERLFDGEEITVTKRGYRKVTGPSTYKADYRLARDSELLDWKFSVARCVVCGTE